MGEGDDDDTWGQGLDDWDTDDARLGQFTTWARWVRDDVRIQIVAWLVASCAVLGPQNSWVLWPGLLDTLWRDSTWGQLLIGWTIATLMTLGWATSTVQLVFTFEQRAMTFPPWSVLVFCNFRTPSIGSVIFFDGSDGRSYVRRVCSVRKQGATPVGYVQTIGDLPGAPDDRPLYSESGAATWLDLRKVRGTLAAGPFPLQVMVATVVSCLALTPTATLAFLATNQPFLFAWLSVFVHFVIIVLACPLT